MPDGSINLKITAEVGRFLSGVNEAKTAPEQLKNAASALAEALGQVGQEATAAGAEVGNARKSPRPREAIGYPPAGVQSGAPRIQRGAQSLGSNTWRSSEGPTNRIKPLRSRHHHACHDATRHRVQTGVAGSAEQELEPSSRAERRPREGTDDGADSVAGGRLADCDFNRGALYPADPIKCRMST
jgi:hypothetical protein